MFYIFFFYSRVLDFTFFDNICLSDIYEFLAQFSKNFNYNENDTNDVILCLKWIIRSYDMDTIVKKHEIENFLDIFKDPEIIIDLFLQEIH
jgi:hypothetical protein